MQRIVAHRGGLLAVFGIACLAAAAAVVAQKQESAATSPEARHAMQLSEAFRAVARRALPSIVSIETRGKAVRMTRGFEFPFDENSPFGELFENDPQLREFFRRMPRQPQQQQQQFRVPRGMGSGFIIDQSGLVMTNSHVVAGAEEVKVRLHDGREFIATDIKADPRSDVAVVRIDGAQDLQAIPLGDSDAVEIADWVLAIGSPFGLDMTVTAGIISAKGRGPGIADREDFLQTDAAINPGNSGGPLLNLAGEVIGINTAISTRSGGYDGVGFAIPVNMAKWVAGQLSEHGRVQRAYLGVSIQPADAQLARQFGVNVGEGTIINQVILDSPAAAAGLQVGDVILTFAGEKVTSPRNLQGIVEKLSVDETYRMTIIRDGDRKTIDVTLREMPRSYALRSDDDGEQDSPTPPPNESKFDDLGIEVQELTAETAQLFGLDADTRGVVVSSVESGSPADLAGLKAGHVIERVGTKAVTDVEEFQAAVKDASLKQGLLLYVRAGDVSRFLVIQSNQ